MVTFVPMLALMALMFCDWLRERRLAERMKMAAAANGGEPWCVTWKKAGA